MANEYKPRLSVEIPTDMDRALKELIPPQLKSEVVRAVLETLVFLLKSHPNARPQVIAAIITKQLNIAETTYREANTNAK